MSYLSSESFFHIYNRGNNRESIFFNEENYLHFLKLFKKHISEIADIYSYCLLPNHFHFLIRIKDITDLPEKYINDETKLHQPFSNLFNAYTKSVNRQENRTGSILQKKFKKVKIESNEQLINTIIYINTNSNHHSVGDYKNYKFSSYHSLVSDKPTLLKRAFVLETFNDIVNFKYVLESKKEKIELKDDIE